MSKPESADGLDVLALALELSRAGETFAMATVVWRQGPSSGQHGSRALVTQDGRLHGWIGGACAEPVLIREATRVLTEGESKLIWLGQAEEFELMSVPEGVVTVPISCQSDGALQIFVEPIVSVPHVVIVGRSPMAHTLESLIADLGWRGERVDAEALGQADISPASVVIVATQGHGDEDAIEVALRAQPTFIGVVASRRRGDAIRAYLLDRGLAAEQLDRLRVPVGLDLGRTTHREIAVAILAELVEMRASGRLRGGVQLPVEPAEAIDPVCGMTVAQVGANRPLSHGGRTYYFCAPGCRVAFAKDPEAFIVADPTQQEVPC